MKLFYFAGRDGITNFGDELNHYLWPHFLPGALDDDSRTLFVGIGTLLNDRLPRASRTVIFGSGVGYYGPPRPEPTWEIHCVRGPLSAHALGLPDSTAVTDPGALIARVAGRERVSVRRTAHAFMPHWDSEPDGWRIVCDAGGAQFIDPRWPTERVIDALLQTDLLITEAMHGAIVADALRIPWIPVRTREAIKTFKWEDWCLSMELDYHPHTLPSVWPKLPNLGVVGRARRWARLQLIARDLARVARHERPQLSRAGLLESRLDQLEERLENVRTRLRSNETLTTC